MSKAFLIFSLSKNLGEDWFLSAQKLEGICLPAFGCCQQLHFALLWPCLQMFCSAQGLIWDGACAEHVLLGKGVIARTGRRTAKKRLTNLFPSDMILEQKEAGTAPPSSPPAAGEGVNMVKRAQPACAGFVVDAGAFLHSRFIFYLEVRDHS